MLLHIQPMIHTWYSIDPSHDNIMCNIPKHYYNHTIALCTVSDSSLSYIKFQLYKRSLFQQIEYYTLYKQEIFKWFNFHKNY